MAALATLNTTTLATRVGPLDGAIQVASAAGLLPGTRLFHGRELMQVISLGVGNWVNVRRGVDGTVTGPHPSSATLTIGRADQFYSQDPVNPPPSEILVSPWINVLTGDEWTAQGDEAGPGLEARLWTKTVNTPSIGALGVRVVTTTW
jgi:hypothetical protein